MSTKKQVSTKKQAGLTLVEIIVAVGVFSIIMLALSGTIIQGLQIRRNNSIESEALVYAASGLEQYKNLWADYESYKCFTSDPAAFRRTIDGCDRATYKPDIPSPAAFKPNPFSFACLDRKGNAYPEAKCNGSDSSFIPELRRVTVTLKDQQDKVRAVLFTEIGNPIPEK
jgi:prepilin-type N-terminal cleavage/methylation domain-containing protein